MCVCVCVCAHATISSSSTRSCLRHFRETRCSFTSCSVSFLTVVLRQMTTSTLRVDGYGECELCPFKSHQMDNAQHSCGAENKTKGKTEQKLQVENTFGFFCVFFFFPPRQLNSLLLDVRTQAENILLTGHLELVGEPEVLHLDLKDEHSPRDIY